MYICERSKWKMRVPYYTSKGHALCTLCVADVVIYQTRKHSLKTHIIQINLYLCIICVAECKAGNTMITETIRCTSTSYKQGIMAFTRYFPRRNPGKRDRSEFTRKHLQTKWWSSFQYGRYVSWISERAWNMHTDSGDWSWKTSTWGRDSDIGMGGWHKGGRAR